MDTTGQHTSYSLWEKLQLRGSGNAGSRAPSMRRLAQQPVEPLALTLPMNGNTKTPFLQEPALGSGSWLLSQAQGAKCEQRLSPLGTPCPAFLAPTGLYCLPNNSNRKQIHSGTARLPHHPKREAPLLPPSSPFVFLCSTVTRQPLSKKVKREIVYSCGQDFY